MPAARVVRPIVRQFKARFAKEIVSHVRAGGHAVVWENERRARLVMPVPKKGDEMDLTLWAIYDLGKQKWELVARGPFKGLATALVPRDCNEIVRHRAERDSIFPGATRTMKLDCLECGACCKDNFVVLLPKDVKRFDDAGRSELTKRPYTRRKDGVLVLRMLESRRCRHLEKDNKCSVYAIRPDACRDFPAGSEPCLFSRDDEYGIVDGARPEPQKPKKTATRSRS